MSALGAPLGRVAEAGQVARAGTILGFPGKLHSCGHGHLGLGRTGPGRPWAGGDRPVEVAPSSPPGGTLPTAKLPLRMEVLCFDGLCLVITNTAYVQLEDNPCCQYTQIPFLGPDAVWGTFAPGPLTV